MNLYLYLNEKQAGPYSEEQIRQMLLAGNITPETLTWKDGMAGWEPLARVISLAGTPPPPPQKKPLFAIVSLGFAGFSLVGWFILLLVAGLAHNEGKATQSFNVVVGLLFMGGISLNLVATVFGIVGAFQNRGRGLSIAGICLNIGIVAALMLLVIIGIMAKQQGIR